MTLRARGTGQHKRLTDTNVQEFRQLLRLLGSTTIVAEEMV